jgi:hypothetical protein
VYGGVLIMIVIMFILFILEFVGGVLIYFVLGGGNVCRVLLRPN